MANTFFTSDLHANHSNILKFCPRPYSTIEEMNEGIIKIWNEQVMPGDTIYNLGDTMFGNNKQESITKLYKRLSGNIFTILGNHCSKQNYLQLEQEIGGRFLGVEYYKKISIQKQSISLCHFPQMVWENSHHGAISLFGHCHGSLIHPGKGLDCGWDNSIKVLGEYRLFSFEDVMRYMRNKEIWTPDHHNARTT